MKEREGKIKDVESLAGIENALNGMLDRADVVNNNVVAVAIAMHSRNNKPPEPVGPHSDNNNFGLIQRIAIKCEQLNDLLLAINDEVLEIDRLVQGCDK